MITCLSLFFSLLSFSSVSFFSCTCPLSGLSGVRANAALIKAPQLSVIHGGVLFCFVVFVFFVSDSGQLIPPRPHEVGDALADLGAVVEVSVAHWSGLPARQLVAAENGGERRWKEHRLDSHGHLPFCCVVSQRGKTTNAPRSGRTQK